MVQAAFLLPYLTGRLKVKCNIYSLALEFRSGRLSSTPWAEEMSLEQLE